MVQNRRWVPVYQQSGVSGTCLDCLNTEHSGSLLDPVRKYAEFGYLDQCCRRIGGKASLIESMGTHALVLKDLDYDREFKLILVHALGYLLQATIRTCKFARKIVWRMQKKTKLSHI